MSKLQASLSDARQFCVPPWTEVHGYQRSIASRCGWRCSLETGRGQEPDSLLETVFKPERVSAMRFTQRLCFLPILAALASCQARGQTNGSHWNVKQAGAVGDGQADCTAIFQKLLNEAGAAGGGVVEVPAGQYRINTGLSIPANVTLSGTYRVAPTLQKGPTGNLAGSVLLAYAGRGATNGPPFIRLAGNNSAIAGFVITYPEWKQT